MTARELYMNNDGGKSLLPRGAAARRSARFTAAIGVLLILAGIVCNPAGYFVLNGGAHSIGSPVFRLFAWGAGGGLVASGVLLILFRRAISPVNLLLLGGVFVFGLVFMEFALATLGLNSPYSLRLRIPDLVPWFTNSQETGSRYIPEKFSDPNWPINKDGFPGAEEFTADACAKADARILLLGDSFTFGVAATQYTKSFASLLERNLCARRNAVVWNTGIPGIGQKQELYSLHTYAPLLRPQVVILAFCTNDFNDNKYPMSANYVFTEGPFVFRYEYLPDGTIRALTPKEAYRRAHPLSEVLSASRVVYQTFNFARKMQQWMDARHERNVSPTLPPEESAASAPGYEHLWGGPETKTLLSQIKDYVDSHDERLLLLLIPFPYDLGVPTKSYRAVVSFCRTLGIDCLEVRNLLEPEDYVANPDTHWNNAGHRKVADALVAGVEAMLEGAGLGASTPGK